MPKLPFLSDRRRDLGLTQAALARSAGISIPTLRGLERGAGSLRSLAAVLPLLGLSWGWCEAEDPPGAALAALRRVQGLTQAGLAARVGCSRPTIVALERAFTGSVQTLLRVLRVLGVRKPLRQAVASGPRGLAPAPNAPARDLVMTPPDLAAALLAHFGERISGAVLDPARGSGAFFDQFDPSLEAHWCELSMGRDFLDWDRPVDWIVTNPPWSKIRDFTRHAMTLAPNIVWLAPLVNLTTKARLRDLAQHGFGIAELVLIDTPKSWPQSGFQLVAAHIAQGHAGGWQVSRLAQARDD
jgi:transcriptional regulator with XRE-family HTH domain